MDYCYYELQKKYIWGHIIAAVETVLGDAAMVINPALGAGVGAVFAGFDLIESLKLVRDYNLCLTTTA